MRLEKIISQTEQSGGVILLANGIEKMHTCDIDVHIFLLLCAHNFLGLDFSGVVIFSAVGFHRFCNFDIFQFTNGVLDLCFGLLNTLGLPKREHKVSHDESWFCAWEERGKRRKKPFCYAGKTRAK